MEQNQSCAGQLVSLDDARYGDARTREVSLNRFPLERHDTYGPSRLVTILTPGSAENIGETQLFSYHMLIHKEADPRLPE